MLPRPRMLLFAAMFCLTVGVLDHGSTAARVSWTTGTASGTNALPSPAVLTQTTTIIPYQSTGYRYAVVPHGGGPSGFEQAGFDDAAFSVGDAGFGTLGYCQLTSATYVGTAWPLLTDLLVRKEFTLPQGATSLRVGVAIDNNVQIFINGTDISGGMQTHSNCASRDSFVFTAPDSLLATGRNVIAIRARDCGATVVPCDLNSTSDLDYLDVQVTADVPPVVVLVHGYEFGQSSAGCDMDGPGSIAEWLSNPVHTDAQQFNIQCLPYDSVADGVKGGASGLWVLIQKATKPGSGINKVDIVAHSMGGLVARWCVEQIKGCSGSVRSITMIGTPNLGTATADVPCALNPLRYWVAAKLHNPFSPDRGACDLTIPAVLRASTGPPPGVAYYLIAGNVGWNPLLVPAPQDCIVQVRSVQGLFNKPPMVFPVSHAAPGPPGSIIFGCQNPDELDSPPKVSTESPVLACVAQILMYSNGYFTSLSNPPCPSPTGPVTAALSANSSSSGAVSALSVQSGLIASGAIANIPVAVPSGQAVVTFVLSEPTDPSVVLTHALLRPGGTPVTSLDPDVAVSSGPGFGGTNQMYFVVTSPAPGAWMMQVSGTTVPYGEWPYDAEALVPGTVVLSAQYDHDQYTTGQTMILSASLAAGGVPVAGGTVTATVSKPDGTSNVFVLTGDATGNYSASFSDTSECGMYQITVTVAGSTAGTPFSRQDRTLAFVGVPGNVIMDPCKADSDGDGLTDAQEINIYHSNPANPYTAGDGYTDGEHVALAKDPTKYCTIMRADVDHDGAVSVLDFVRVAQYFAQTIPPAPARYDQDGDNKISVLDFVKMAQVFTRHVSACP